MTTDPTLVRGMQDGGVVAAIRAQRLLGVVRAGTAEQAREQVLGLRDAGVLAVEVSLSTPGALDIVRGVGGIGAGTVHTVAQAERALDAGAAFLVAPTLVPGVVRAAREAGVPVLPGAATASEVVQALDLGADLVKLFPATLYPPATLADLLQALPDAPLVPTGGVTPDSAPHYIAAGAAAVGLGSALTPATAPHVLAALARAVV